VDTPGGYKQITATISEGVIALIELLPSLYYLNKISRMVGEMHNLNLFRKLYRIACTHHPTHTRPVHAYRVFN